MDHPTASHGAASEALADENPKVLAYLEAIRRLLVIIMLVVMLQLCGAIVYFFSVAGEK